MSLSREGSSPTAITRPIVRAKNIKDLLPDSNIHRHVYRYKLHAYLYILYCICMSLLLSELKTKATGACA
jgi:hypothetical protein